MAIICSNYNFNISIINVVFSRLILDANNYINNNTFKKITYKFYNKTIKNYTDLWIKKKGNNIFVFAVSKLINDSYQVWNSIIYSSDIVDCIII